MATHPEFPGPRVSPQWLAARLGNPGLRIIDGTTWMQPNPVGASTMSPAHEHWRQAHLPGSIHWDLVEDYSQPNGTWPFTRPDAVQLAALLGRSGIHPEDHLVLYGMRHPNIITRAWWVLHSMGLEKVSVLDGGLEAWQTAGLPLDNADSAWPSTEWQPTQLQSRGHADLTAVRHAMETDSALLVNALSAAQFAGDLSQPHYGRPGHIPSSISLPAASLHQNGKLISLDSFIPLALAAGVPPEKDTPIIVYCGGGLAASMTYFHLHDAGWTQLRLYDNSLLEWAAHEDLPMRCLS